VGTYPLAPPLGQHLFWILPDRWPTHQHSTCKKRCMEKCSVRRRPRSGERGRAPTPPQQAPAPGAPTEREYAPTWPSARSCCTLHALARTRVQRKSGPWPKAWPLARLPGAPPEFRPPETHPSVGLGAAVQTRGKLKRHAERSRHVPVPNPPSASAHAWGTGRTEAWDRAKSS
jgi:hypothetical protein